MPPVTLTIFIGVLAKRTVFGTVSGSLPAEGSSVYTGEFLTKGNEARILQEITEKTERRRRQVWRANSFFASERCGTI